MFRSYVFNRLLEDLCEAEGAGKAILLATGAFAPIHRGHLEMFQQAKDYLESQGYQVEGGYISPKHDEYVKSKLRPGEPFFNVDQRIQMIQQALNNASMDWIKIFDWESRQTSPRNKSEVVAKIRKMHPDVNVMFVCGEDNCTLDKYPGIAHQGGFQWVATPRGSFSSTRVRNALQTNNEKELDLLLHPDVKKTLTNKL